MMKSPMKWLSITLVLLLVSILTLLFFLPLPPLLNGLSFSRAVFDDHHQLLRLTLSQDAKYRLRTPLADISPELVAATILQEDRYFRWHLGVNPLSLMRAGATTYVTRSRRMGGSTLTMQVARLRFGLHSKTLLGKIEQVIRALQLELHYSKQQLLEAYLNLAPYGNNIEGIGAASFIYFGKPASALSLPEALALVVIPQNPSKRVPDRSGLNAARYKLYRRYIAAYPDAALHAPLMHLPLQMQSIHTIPFLAPHFVASVLSRTPSDQDHIVTTLDFHLQNQVERITRRYLARKANLGVNNAAVLLVDSRDMSIKVMMGSANFYQAAIGGQVNGTDIKRSPGSTLKPFIYALALDQGLIHPETMLKDVARSFGHYNPENFDNDFVGPIKAKDALILSRNIPAVTLANQLKHPTLYEFLQTANISRLKAESYYGLALVLGGAELSMTELVSLYAMLANDGVLRSLRFTLQEKAGISKHMLSEEASFLIIDMLQATPLPLTQSTVLPIAWKTGTSSGYRDAWTIGIIGPYVLAVWMGNFNNQANPALVGKELAAPLFFELANALQTKQLPLSLLKKNPQRLHLTRVLVCKVSGLLPTRYCKDREKTWFIPGKSPIKTDTLHREVAINTKTGLRTCHFDSNTRFDVYEFWSSDLLSLFKRAGIERRIPPPYDISCSTRVKSQAGFAPQIVSPEAEVEYVMRAAANHTAIPLTAVVDADVRHVYWFMNETFIGKTRRDQPFFWQAKPGRFVVRAVDDQGLSDVRDMIVKLAG